MKMKANGKINLTLDIIGKREDGYHIIDSVFQSVSLFDEITVEKADRIILNCSDKTIENESNIALKAARNFLKMNGICTGAKITVKKNIPKASGMGGGSADAAAVILALDKIYNTNLSKEQLCKTALTVGADVPFCIVGGTARIGGIGEKIEQLPFLPDCAFLILKHGEKLSTADMYKKSDGKPFKEGHTEQAVEGIINRNLKKVCDNVSNVFCDFCNSDEVIETVGMTSPLCCSVSGSGPTVFAIYENAHSANKACDFLKSKGYNPIVAYPEKSGVIFE